VSLTELAAVLLRFPCKGTAMPRYHFELTNGHRLPDPTGLECKGDQDAKSKADLIARRIADETGSNGNGRFVRVVDDDGSDIYRVPV
jgi:hypothetical protein